MDIDSILVHVGSNDITKLVLNVLHQDINIDSIVVHMGFNDIMKGSSEQLKLDFKELIDSLLDTTKIHILVPFGSKTRFIRRIGSTQIIWVPGSVHSIIRLR